MLCVRAEGSSPPAPQGRLSPGPSLMGNASAGPRPFFAVPRSTTHPARRPRQPLRRGGFPSPLAVCSFPPPLPSFVLLSSLREPLQNAGGNGPSLAFCRQGALFFSSYHPEKEHSLSLARPMLNGSVPRPLPGGGPLPCAARAVRPGISNPTSGRLQDAPRRLEKGPPRLWARGGPPGPDARLSDGQGGPGSGCPAIRNRAAGPALRDGPSPCQKARPVPSGQGRHSCAARAGSRREHRLSSVWRRLCLSE